ncbi:hypothetical protein NLX83_15800 [Allokutzneria sp. A3M-2-11 16]|uniref:hypothetical protein n=1 Tax=Allokutzneria sp. A3M-2-11 16 TaxID=2962043 RepID=UPI0020B8BD82|nr:hypothetical protein [Allokutzneria sp. A3M-2-11 16]MCP3800731.1 hypothetical protein [Allokutzneria sp. A3M-2-11 16]
MSAHHTAANASSFSPTPPEPPCGLSPTPRARDWSNPSSLDWPATRWIVGRLPDAVIRLLPTPQARDYRSPTDPSKLRAGGHQLNLPDVLLPTPTSSNPNDGEDVAHWLRRQAHHKQRGINGNGAGVPLGIAVRLLPAIPTTEPSGSTPPLFPTPRATEGTKGSPRQHGSSGDLMLSSAVIRLLPTPCAGPNRNSRTAILTQRSGPGLEQAVEIVLGTTPQEVENWATAPRTWTAARTGAPTPPPSDDGKRDSTAPRRTRSRRTPAADNA